MLNPRDIDGLLDELSERSTFAKPDIIVLGDIIRETFSEESEIWKAYRELCEQIQQPASNDGQRRSSKAHTREFKEIVDAAKMLASRREIPPPTKDQREYQESQVALIIDHQFTQSRWFTAAKVALVLGSALILGGTINFGWASYGLMDRINEVSKFAEQTAEQFNAKIKSEMTDINREMTEFVKAKKTELDKNLKTAADGLVEDGRMKLYGIISAKGKEYDGIISAKGKELDGIISAKENEFVSSLKAATERATTIDTTYTQQAKQRQDNLDKEQPKLDQLVNSVSEQETRLGGLASRLDGLQSVSRPALDIANTLASGTTINNLQRIGKALELSACFLIGLSILACASLVVSGFALFYSFKKTRA